MKSRKNANNWTRLNKYYWVGFKLKKTHDKKEHVLHSLGIDGNKSLVEEGMKIYKT